MTNETNKFMGLNRLREQLLKDKMLDELEIAKFSEGFDWWFKCVVGAYDYQPDFLNGKFTPDTFNSVCTDYDCTHRGKLCGRASGLNATDVLTLAALTQGETFSKTAAMLYVSVPGMKSRVTKIRQKTEAKNTAALTEMAGCYGIN